MKQQIYITGLYLRLSRDNEQQGESSSISTQRQMSKKVKAALHTKFMGGTHYAAYAPIGYVKDPEKKGHLIPDT